MSVPDEGYSRNVSCALFDTYASSLDVVLKPYFGGIDELEVRKAALTGSDVTGSHVTGSDVSHVTEECYASGCACTHLTQGNPFWGHVTFSHFR
jgi:hypothetical protein